MARGGYRLGIALIVVLAIGLGWLLLDRPWQEPAPTATDAAMASDAHARVRLESPAKTFPSYLVRSWWMSVESISRFR